MQTKIKNFVYLCPLIKGQGKAMGNHPCEQFPQENYTGEDTRNGEDGAEEEDVNGQIFYFLKQIEQT